MNISKKIEILETIYNVAGVTCKVWKNPIVKSPEVLLNVEYMDEIEFVYGSGMAGTVRVQIIEAAKRQCLNIGFAFWLKFPAQDAIFITATK